MRLMDIEKLTKSQIVLLTLLVSFVTSMATGIVTVSLMEQAPPTIAQTVNRVVERTVERVVPSESQPAATVITTEKTVVVREADLIAQAVAASAPSIVRLYERDGGGTFIGFGVAIADNRILADSSAITEGATLVTRNGDAVIEFKVLQRNSSLGIVVLEPTASTTAAKGWTPIPVSKDAPGLGQTVIAITGEKSNRITTGIVTEIDATMILETSLVPDATLSGGPLVSIDGTLLGIRTGVSRTATPGGFIKATAISSMLNAAVIPDPSNQPTS